VIEHLIHASLSPACADNETLAIASVLHRSRTLASAAGGPAVLVRSRARIRPDPSVSRLGSARLLLSSRRRGPGYRNGERPSRKGFRPGKLIECADASEFHWL
jgi:hypothetical protein